jgi:hypothetical protein
MESGYRLDVLQATIVLYYKSGNSFKKAIGNYMISGEWKTDYDRLVVEAEKGNLKNYVETETHRDKRNLPTALRI